MTALLFLVPPWWPLLLLLPALLWAGGALARAAARRRSRELDGREAAVCGAPTHRRARAACAAGAAACAAAALLQPVWGEGDGEPLGPDVALCLDVSRSMAARDVAPTRLGAAQRAIAALAGAGPGTRLGLLTYAGDARLGSPLTSDLSSVATIAGSAFAGAVQRPGTDLGAAIDAGLALLQRGRARSGSVLVLTDGEDFTGNGLAAAARARAAGVPVHCIGFGTTGGSKVVVEGDGGESFLRDSAGMDVVTRLERDQLEAVAAAAGGRYLAPRDASDVLALFDSVLVPAAAAVAAHDAQRNPAHRFQWPLLAAVLLWMLRLSLTERRR